MELMTQFNNQKGITQIALLLILLIGIAVAVYGVKHGRTVLKPKAFGQICAQVITPARNPQTGECKVFPNSCIPSGWVRVSSCPTPPVYCTTEVMECPDGSFVGRDANNNCKFFPCPSPTTVKYFKYEMSDYPNEFFIVKMIDVEVINKALADLEGTRGLVVSGRVRQGDGGFNIGFNIQNKDRWSWHLDPETIGLSEVTIELCDGRPSLVEEDLNNWIGQRYCPWGAKIAEVYDSPPSIPACIQVITPARDPVTGECREFSTPCYVPYNWERVEGCIGLYQ